MPSMRRLWCWAARSSLLSSGGWATRRGRDGSLSRQTIARRASSAFSDTGAVFPKRAQALAAASGVETDAAQASRAAQIAARTNPRVPFPSLMATIFRIDAPTASG